jgi:hypothetical protein
MNKYMKWYNNLVNHRKNNAAFNTYVEQHHIIPRCLGGSNNRDNLVKLTAREHFICHYLLTKMYIVGTLEWYKMHHAFMIMAASSNGKRYFNSRLYNACRENFSKCMSRSQRGENNSQYGKLWITNISLEKNMKIKIDELNHWLAIGWTRGRIYYNSDWKLTQFTSSNLIRTELNHLAEIERQKTRDKKEFQRNIRVELYRNYYLIYKEFGFEKFKIKTGFKFSKPHLVQMFARLLPEFVPQNGKKRGL